MNITLSCVKLKVFPLRLETRKKCSLLPLLFSMLLEVLHKAMRQEEIKNIQIAKEEVFADDMVLCIVNLEKGNT